MFKIIKKQLETALFFHLSFKNILFSFAITFFYLKITAILQVKIILVRVKISQLILTSLIYNLKPHFIMKEIV